MLACWLASFPLVFSTRLMDGVAGVMFGLFGLPMLWALFFAGISSLFNSLFLALVFTAAAAQTDQEQNSLLAQEYLAAPFWRYYTGSKHSFPAPTDPEQQIKTDIESLK